MSTRLWTPRTATAADAAGIAELFQVVMGTARNEAHDAWKFRANTLTPPLIVVAEHGSRIVGQYALWPTALDIGGEAVLGAQSLDTMTHPEYQGQGMFTTLAKACYALAASHGVQLLYGFPNDNSYPGFIRRLNWDHTGDVSSWTRPLQLAVHPRVPGALGPIGNTLTRLLPVQRGARADVDANVTLAEVAELAARSAEKDTCRVARTLEWLQYRTDQASGHAYRWVGIRSGGQLVAVALWGVDILVPYRKALLAEVIGAADALPAAVGAAVADARAWGAASMSAVGAAPEVARALQKNGFFRHAAARLIVKPLVLKEWKANVHHHPGWRISGLDLDTY